MPPKFRSIPCLAACQAGDPERFNVTHDILVTGNVESAVSTSRPPARLRYRDETETFTSLKPAALSSFRSSPYPDNTRSIHKAGSKESKCFAA
jgi:hypothetical protein